MTEENLTFDCNLIERKNYLDSIYELFYEGKERIISLFGKSGYGKSSLCHCICDNNKFREEYNILYFDFDPMNRRSCVWMIDSFIRETFDMGCYDKTFNMLEKYSNCKDINKPSFLVATIDNFIEETNTIISEENKSILFIVDTIEVMIDTDEWQIIKHLLVTLVENKNIYVIFSGINQLTDICSYPLEVTRYDAETLRDLFIKRIPKMKNKLKKRDSIVLNHLANITDRSPIKAELLITIILSQSNITEMISKIEFLNTIGKESIDERLLDLITEILGDEIKIKALRLLAFFRHQVDATFFSIMLSIDKQSALNIVSEFSTLPGIKSTSATVKMHNLVSEIIRNHLPFSNDELLTYSELAIKYYDAQIKESEKMINGDNLKRFTVEKIISVALFGRKCDAIKFIETALYHAIDLFDYSFCNIIISAVEAEPQLIANETWSYLLNIYKADIALSRCEPESVSVALNISETLKKSILFNDDKYKVLALSIKACCAINPCTFPNLDLFEAVDVFKETINVLNNEPDDEFLHRLPRVYFNLATAFVKVGNNIEAANCFDKALELSKDNIVRFQIFLEQNKMLRLQQNVPNAMSSLQECQNILLELRYSSISINDGKYIYYKANTLRDEGKFEAAREAYTEAEKTLINSSDSFTKAELFLDYCWLWFRESDSSKPETFQKVFEYLEKGWEIVQENQYGGEYSEYWHIKYEVANEREEYDDAMIFLENAINEAKNYSNIYMILDCLNHKVQQYFRIGKFNDIPAIIDEMYQYEKRGCGIRVFRARARLVQGDVYYKQGENNNAFKEWGEGFINVALYGNSFTNDELFRDLYESRKEKLIDVLCALGKKAFTSYKKKWIENRISSDFDFFINDLSLFEQGRGVL